MKESVVRRHPAVRAKITGIISFRVLTATATAAAAAPTYTYCNIFTLVIFLAFLVLFSSSSSAGQRPADVATLLHSTYKVVID